MPKLTVIDGPHKGEVFELTANRTLVGRELNNGIYLPDGLVSRHHAEILREGDTYKLRDLQSTNGTFVNDQSTTETTLRNGDVVRMADVTLRFDISTAPSIGLKTPIFKPAAPAQPQTPSPPPDESVPPSKPAPTPPAAEPAKVTALPPARPGFLTRLLHKAPAQPTDFKQPVTPPQPAAPPKPSEPAQPIHTPRPDPAKEIRPPVPPAPIPPPPKPAGVIAAPKNQLLSRPPPVEISLPATGRPVRHVIIFGIIAAGGGALLVAGYQVAANSLRFFGLLLLVVGVLNLVHDWRPLPPKPKI